MHFLPSAIYRQQEGLMSLQLDVALKDTSDNDSTAIALLLEAVFTFEETPALADIPDYFYKNSIAIVYPYIRAFITNLTATANITPLILPLLNLSVLEEELKKRTSSE